MASNLSALLAQLQVENKGLLTALAEYTGLHTSAPIQQTCPNAINTSKMDRLDRELQLARKLYDQALHKRQQQSEELEELVCKCQELYGAVGNQRSSAQQHICQLEAQLAATAHQVHSTISLQVYSQEVLEQHKLELTEAETQVQSLRAQVAEAQKQLEQATAKLLHAQAGREAAKRAAGVAQQQMVAARMSRALVIQQLQDQCKEHAMGVLSTEQWQQIWALDMASMESCRLEHLLSAIQQQGLGDEVDAQQIDDQAARGQHSEVTAQQTALDFVKHLLTATGCLSTDGLVSYVRAQLQASATLDFIY